MSVKTFKLYTKITLEDLHVVSPCKSSVEIFKKLFGGCVILSKSLFDEFAIKLFDCDCQDNKDVKEIVTDISYLFDIFDIYDGDSSLYDAFRQLSSTFVENSDYYDDFAYNYGDYLLALYIVLYFNTEDIKKEN